MIKNKQLLWLIGIIILISSVFTLVMYNGFNKAATTKTVTVVTNEINVYKNTSFVKANEVGKLKKGNKVVTVEVKEKYTKIKLNGSQYYVDTKYLDIRSSGLSKASQNTINKALIKSKKIKKQLLYTGKTKSVSSITLKKDTKKASDKVTNTVVDFNKNVQNNYLGFNNSNVKDNVSNSNTLEFVPTKPGGVPENDTVVVPTPTPTQPVEEPKGTPVLKDTVKYYNEAYGNSDFGIVVESYNVVTNKTPYYSLSDSSKQVGTLNIGASLYPVYQNQQQMEKDISKNKTTKFVAVSYNGNEYLVKRDVLTANYQVFKTGKAISEKWNYNVDAGSSSMSLHEQGIAFPMYDAPNSVNVTASIHDPIYDMLAAGTTVIPTAVTNGSTVKPKYGTGASTSVKVTSKGSASADGWVAPTLKNRYYNSPNEKHRDSMMYDFTRLGFLMNPEILSSSRNALVYFKTQDGSILDANYIVDESKSFGEFTISGYTKTESYRTKKMLEVVLPYVFDSKYSNAVVSKVHSDFIAYANAKPTASKTVKYSGFSATFSKAGTDKYKLVLNY